MTNMVLFSLCFRLADLPFKNEGDWMDRIIIVISTTYESEREFLELCNMQDVNGDWSYAVTDGRKYLLDEHGAMKDISFALINQYKFELCRDDNYPYRYGYSWLAFLSPFAQPGLIWHEF